MFHSIQTDDRKVLPTKNFFIQQNSISEIKQNIDILRLRRLRKSVTTRPDLQEIVLII